MDELRGKEGTWRLDGESVRIRFHRQRRQDPLLRQLGQCLVPLAAVTAAEFDPEGAGRRWSLRLVLREGADPYTAVGATFTRRTGVGRDCAHPFRLTGPASSALLGEYWAEQITTAADRARQSSGPPAAGRLARQLVPPVPLHLRSSEGTAAFDGTTVRLAWPSSAPRRKRRERVREFPLAGIIRVEWVPSDGWQWDVLRVVTEENQRSPEPDPKRDLSCLRCYPGREGAAALVLAATATAHQWAADRGAAAQLAAPPAVGGRTGELLAMLETLHDEGLLTDAELAAKRADLRDRG